MVSKKIVAPWYSERKTVYRNGRFEEKVLPEGCLFSKGEYKAGIKREDLPEHYVEIWNHGLLLMDVKNVVDMEYKPNYFVDNHVFKDDSLYISWSEKLIPAASEKAFSPFGNYDKILWNWSILTFVESVMKYADGPIKEKAAEIEKLVRDKIVWYIHTDPEHYEVPSEYMPFSPKVTYIVRDMSKLKRPRSKEEQIKTLDVFCKKFHLDHEATVELPAGTPGRVRLAEMAEQYPVLSRQAPIRPIFLYCFTEEYGDAHEDMIHEEIMSAFGRDRGTVMRVYARMHEETH